MSRFLSVIVPIEPGSNRARNILSSSQCVVLDHALCKFYPPIFRQKDARCDFHRFQDRSGLDTPLLKRGMSDFSLL